MPRSKRDIKIRQETDRIISVWDKKGKLIVKDGKVVKKEGKK